MALLTVKGGKVHRRFGKIYFWLMAVVCLTAIVVAIYKPVLFLALVAVFSFYFCFRGYRVLLTKRASPQAIDWLGVVLMLLAGLGLLAVGILQPTGVALPAPAVSSVFGAGAILLAAIDIFQFLRPPADKNAWWFNHMSGMLGSYIAAVTAFSAVNFSFLPPAARWLWPTAIGTPAIVIWIAYYKRKFARRPDAASATVA